MLRILFSALLFATSGFASGPDPKTLVVSQDDLARAKSLVNQLGDPQFTVRETAQRELASMGRKALQPLAEAVSDSPDPEVRLRCRKLIPDARADDFQARLDTFLADTDAKYKHDLPGLNVFFSATGKNESARKLYLDILKSEENRKLLVDSEGDTTGMATVVQNRALQLYQRQNPRAMVINGQVVQPTAGTRPTYQDVLALLIVDTKAPADKTPRRNITSSPAYSMQIVPEFRTEASANTPNGEIIRKVIGNWLDSRTEALELYYGMNFLTNANQKDEAIRAAKKLLATNTGPSVYRGMAMSTLARMGGKEAVGIILPYLTDETLCTRMQIQVGEIIEIQTRDVALATVVSLTGQKVADYGFTSRGTTNVVSYSTQWFTSEEDRKKGLQKWAEWAKANPKELEVKVEKK